MDLADPKIYIINTLIVMAIILGVGIIGASNMKKIPGALQNALEAIFEGLTGLFKDALGPNGQKNLPLAITLFLFILLSNLIGQVPFFKSPTATPSTTVGLGVM